MSTGQFKGGILDDWRVELITVVPHFLETASILHVALLVYLRLLSILKPLSYQEIHIKLRHTGIKIIWIMSITVRLIAVLTQRFKTGKFYIYYRYIVLHGFHTIPVMCIIVMYGKLILTLKSKRNGSNAGMVDNARIHAEAQNKKTTLLVQRVVLFLIVCYVPYIAWAQYWYIKFYESVDYNDSEVIINIHLVISDHPY